MAVGESPRSGVVVLVVGVRRPVALCRFNLGCHRKSKRGQLVYEFEGVRCLSSALCKDDRPVLWSSVWPLSVHLCGIVDLEEPFRDRFEADEGGVERDLDDLGVSRRARTDLSVAGCV